MKIDFTKEIMPSKHFRNTWLRKWNYDMNELRSLLIRAKIEKIGQNKYEAYVKSKEGNIKIIFVDIGDKIFIITGTERKG